MTQYKHFTGNEYLYIGNTQLNILQKYYAKVKINSNLELAPRKSLIQHSNARVPWIPNNVHGVKCQINSKSTIGITAYTDKPTDINKKEYTCRSKTTMQTKYTSSDIVKISAITYQTFKASQIL